ncbi:putative regulatory associated protein of TOR [Dioscorea sansibarensis]
MQAANWSPISYRLLPSTRQNHMCCLYCAHIMDTWDEICLAKLPQLIEDPKAEFQPWCLPKFYWNLINLFFMIPLSPFFTEQLTAFEVWLDYGSEHKKLPEQLPIVLQQMVIKDKQPRSNSFVVGMDKKWAAGDLLRELASHCGRVIQQDKSKKMALPRDVRSIQQLELVPVVATNVPIDPSCSYGECSLPHFKGLT